MQIYLVGGAVRDTLLGQSVYDKDFVVVGARPDILISHGFRQVGADFPVFLHPETHHEYALARRERKSGSGHQGFDIDINDVSLTDDLARRDLTINAMALPVAGLFDDRITGDVIDPYGGQRDLTQRMLRHVSPAFSEDPLRVLRVARFYARFYELGFKVAPETQELMQAIAKRGEFSQLSRERIWAESAKALAEPAGYAYFQLMDDLDVLMHLLPDLSHVWQNKQKRQLSLDAMARAAQQQASTSIKFSLLIAGFIGETHGIDKLKYTTQTLNTPNTISRSARLLMHHYQDIIEIINGTASAQQILQLIENTKAQKDDSCLRTLWHSVNLLHNSTHPYQRLMSLLNAYRSITIADVADGLTGKAIGDALTQLRIRNINNTL